jgi:hypothetical protein
LPGGSPKGREANKEIIMKKFFITSLMVVLLTTLAVPTLAQEPLQDPDLCDLSFNVDVVKLKGILILKQVAKNFNFNLNVSSQTSGLPQWAEVEAFKCDRNEDNEAAVLGFVSTNGIVGSFNGFIGVAQVNQAAGLLNNQGNILAAGLTGTIPGGQPTSGITMVEAAVEKTNINNELSLMDDMTTDGITESFNGFQGLGQVNQASGVLNNQNNVLVLGANLNNTGIVAENDTFLSMNNTGNELAVSPGENDAANSFNTTAGVMDSYNGYTGVAQLNQGPGALNNQTNITSIAYAGYN